MSQFDDDDFVFVRGQAMPRSLAAQKLAGRGFTQAQTMSMSDKEIAQALSGERSPSDPINGVAVSHADMPVVESHQSVDQMADAGSPEVMAAGPATKGEAAQIAAQQAQQAQQLVTANQGATPVMPHGQAQPLGQSGIVPAGGAMPPVPDPAAKAAGQVPGRAAHHQHQPQAVPGTHLQPQYPQAQAPVAPMAPQAPVAAAPVAPAPVAPAAPVPQTQEQPAALPVPSQSLAAIKPTLDAACQLSANEAGHASAQQLINAQALHGALKAYNPDAYATLFPEGHKTAQALKWDGLIGSKVLAVEYTGNVLHLITLDGTITVVGQFTQLDVQ